MSVSKFFFTVSLFFLLSPLMNAQPFSLFIQGLEDLPVPHRQSAVDSFRLQHRSYPICEADTVAWYICYSGAARIRIAGDETNWKPTLEMKHVEGTDLWYRRAVYPSDARMEYKIVYNDNDWCLDSLNPRQAWGGFGANSELAMPSYRESLLLATNPGQPHGSLLDTLLFSDQCGEIRRMKIYLPPAYRDAGRSYPLVVYHDGGDYLEFARILNILDNLALSHHLPVIAIFVIPVQRDPEYSGGRQGEYTGFIVQELFPWLERNFRILPGAGNHAVTGISNGGNIALWIAGRHPGVFGKVAVHSSNIERNVMKTWKQNAVLPSRLYIEIGKYDLPFLLSKYDDFSGILRQRQVSTNALIYSSGHNWNAWRNHMGEALLYLFADRLPE